MDLKMQFKQHMQFGSYLVKLSKLKMLKQHIFVYL